MYDGNYMAVQTPTAPPNIDINSDSMSLYGELSCIRSSFWNSLLSLKVFPALPANEQTAKRVYNYKQRTQVTLRPEDAVFIGNVILNELIPASQKGEPFFKCIDTASRINFIAVSNGIEETKEFNPYVGFYTDVDEKGRPGNKIFFKFRPRKVYTKFGDENAEYEETVMPDLVYFAKFLQSAIALTGCAAHSMRNMSKVETVNNNSFKEAVAHKLGLTYNTTVNYVGYNRGGSGYTVTNAPQVGGGYVQQRQPQQLVASVSTEPLKSEAVASFDDIATDFM